MQDGKENRMLTEYLVEAMVTERRAELDKCFRGEAARKLCMNDKAPRRSLGSLIRTQSRESRARRAASAAGHSLSTME